MRSWVYSFPIDVESQDFDANGSTDFSDFILFAQAFGSNSIEFDLNSDGVVEFGDFLIFAQAFGAAGSRVPSTWVDVTPATGPPGRLDHTLVLALERSWLVLFGGRRDVDLNDTWVFSLDTETRQV